MTQEIELEWKNLLTKQEFDYLYDMLPFPKYGQKQINYYFETEDFLLKQQHCALRIREKNGSFQLTLKQPYKNGILETHDIISEDEAASWLNGNMIGKHATERELKKANIPLEKLMYLGKLTTNRYEYSENGIIFVLDHSTYNGVEDYELEIEAPDEQQGITVFEQILTEYNIKKKPTPNKILRFFHTL